MAKRKVFETPETPVDTVEGVSPEPETPAAPVPDSEREPEPEPAPVGGAGRSVHPVVEESYVMVVAEGYGAGAVVSATAPGHKDYHIRVDGVRYVHVGDLPDGRWVYRPD